MNREQQLRHAFFAFRHCSNWPEITKELLNGRSPSYIKMRNGILLYSQQNPLPIIDEIFFKRVYTTEISLPQTGVVVDIGANIGVFTLYARSLTHANIIAVEPLLSNYNLLCRNIEANNLSNVLPICSAVSNTSGIVKLYITEADTGNLLFDHSIGGKIKKYVEVPCTTLQNIMNEHNLASIDFLKLDCEGSEGNILSSMSEEYLLRIREITIEFHDHVSILKHEAICELLQKIGFKIRLKHDGVSPFGYVYAWQ